MNKTLSCWMLAAPGRRGVSTSALAATDVGVSVSVNQPGFYGRIDLGNQPPPMVIYAEPVIIGPVRFMRNARSTCACRPAITSSGRAIAAAIRPATNPSISCGKTTLVGATVATTMIAMIDTTTTMTIAVTAKAGHGHGHGHH